MSTEDIIKEAASEKALIIEALLNSMDKPDPEIDAIWSSELKQDWMLLEKEKLKLYH